jgi:6-pyruvoyltetrahydropterin/6-carboxytetrahydropterin synthase
MIVDLRVLDGALRTEVVERFDHHNLNTDVAEFAEGKQVPTGENLARLIAERVQRSLGAAALVTQVTVAEDATLSATWRG